MSKKPPSSSVTLKGRHGRRLSNLARELGFEIVGGRGSHVVVSNGARRVALWPPRSRQDFERQASKLEKTQ